MGANTLSRTRKTNIARPRSAQFRKAGKIATRASARNCLRANRKITARTEPQKMRARRTNCANPTGIAARMEMGGQGRALTCARIS